MVAVVLAMAFVLAKASVLVMALVGEFPNCMQVKKCI